jgi:hypothetical protein
MRRALLAVLIVAVGTPLVGGEEKSAKADPAASKLLADARAARAMWKDFPGFRADIEVNLDGKVSKGTVEVNPDGKAKYDGLSKDAEAWVKPVLGSIIGHRIDGPVHDTPCAFVDEDTAHPQGRLIRVLNDEMHSGYRIRDDQILTVNRSVEGRPFTISVLENRKNAEGKYLSVSFVVDRWNPTTGELVRSEANLQGFTRVGRFDLPSTARVITAEKLDVKAGGVNGKHVPSARSFTLSNHKLAEPAK